MRKLCSCSWVDIPTRETMMGSQYFWHRSLSLFLLLGIFLLCCPAQSMAADEPTELGPLVINNLLNGSIDVAGVPFSYTGVGTVSFDFSNDAQGRPVVQIKNLVEIDLEGFRIAFPQVVERQARSESCSTRVTPHSPNVTPQGNGTVVATERIKYEGFACTPKPCPTLKNPVGHVRGEMLNWFKKLL